MGTIIGLVDVINSALIKIGEKPIMSIDDPYPRAEAARYLFPIVSRKLIGAYDWSCARKTGKLNQLTNVPSYINFEYAYQLPKDPECLAVRGISLDGYKFVYTDAFYNNYNNPKESTYEIEGDKLYSDLSTVVIKYTGYIDVAQMDMKLIEVLEWALASELAYNITSSVTNVASLRDEYRRALRKASCRNGLEKQPSQPEGDSTRIRFAQDIESMED